MSLIQEFHQIAGEYITGTRSLDDLHGWLVEHAQAVVDAEDPELIRRTGRAWTLISEFDADHLDEQDVRRGLADMIGMSLPVRA